MRWTGVVASASAWVGQRVGDPPHLSPIPVLQGVEMGAVGGPSRMRSRSPAVHLLLLLLLLLLCHTLPLLSPCEDRPPPCLHVQGSHPHHPLAVLPAGPAPGRSAAAGGACCTRPAVWGSWQLTKKACPCVWDHYTKIVPMPRISALCPGAYVHNTCHTRHNGGSCG